MVDSDLITILQVYTTRSLSLHNKLKFSYIQHSKWTLYVVTSTYYEIYSFSEFSTLVLPRFPMDRVGA